MTLTIRTRVLTFCSLLAASCLLAAPAAQAATDPAVACAQAVAKNLSKCTKKAVGIHASCYKADGADCAADNEKLAGAAAKARDGVISKCTTAAVSSSGYGAYTNLQLGSFIGDTCLRHAELLSDRTFGVGGSGYTAADEDGKKCIVTIAKEGGKLLGGSLQDVSKCVEDGCTFDFSARESDTVAKVTDKCPTFATLIGIAATTWADNATDQVRPSLASPCDPMDPTRCVMPFPNDYFSVASERTDSGRELAFGSATLPKTIGGQAVTPDAWNEADGFSIGAMILFQNADIDLGMTGAAPITDISESLDPATPAMLLDADTGEQQLMWWERDQRGATTADQPLIGRVAKNLKQGHRYIVVLRHMKNSGGTDLPAPAGFALYRDNTPSPLLPVEARRTQMEALFTTLTGFGVIRGELYLAWDFTTQSAESTAGRLLNIRDDAFATLGSNVPAFTVDSAVESGDPQIFRQVDGTFEVPQYLTGDGSTGEGLNVDVNGTPVVNGSYTASFRCLIPNSATTGGTTPVIPARIAIYGHGLLGSHTEVSAGNVQDMANEHNFVICATDWTGFDETDELGIVLDILSSFSNFPPFIGRQHQGVLNQLFLARLLKHASGFTSHTAFQISGNSMLDTSDVFYDGNSQGGILGGVVAAVAQDITRFSLGVPGINYSLLLYRSTDFEVFDDLLDNQYPNAVDRNLLISVAQILWDRTDPNGHIQHMLSDPYAGTPAKKALYQVAYGDHQVAPVSVEIAARSNGMYIHTPVLDPGKVISDTTPYYGIPAIPSDPYDGSAMVIWDSGNPECPLGDTSPVEITPIDPEWADLGACPMANGSDPHSCPRKNVDARTQKSEFLKTTGAIVDVCSGLACSAN